MTVSIPNAKVRTRRRWFLPAYLTWSVLGLPGVLWAVHSGLDAHTQLLPLAAAYFTILIATAALQLVTHVGELQANATGLFSNGKLIVDRNAISYGHITRARGKQVLRLVMRGRLGYPVDIAITDEAQANELLAALHLEQTTAEYVLWAGRSRFTFAWAAYMLLGSLGVGGAVFGVMHEVARAPSSILALPFALLLLAVVGTLTAGLSQEMKLAVGLDGVWLHQRLVEKRFIPFREIVSAERAGADVVLKLADHTTLEFHHSMFRQADVVSVVAKVRAGIEASRADATHAGESVARNGRTVREWIASAAKAHERAANYRAPVVPQDDLWRIVEDASATATERAGAALALRAELSNDGKTRLRIAAGACAEQKLRIALESVVAADDEALVAALEPLEDSHRMMRRA